MDTVICGAGPMGRTVADDLRAAGHVVRLIGRPSGTTHPARAFAAADVVFDFSIATAVAGNVAAALDGGCRRFVIGTTAWSGQHGIVEEALRTRGAAAVVGATFSPGASLLLAMVGDVATALRRLGGYDPYVVEWHRAGKRDRPSGTALELAARLIAADPAKQCIAADSPSAPDSSALEVVGVRAGAAPGSHLVGWDAAGETVELRVTARDRHAYAAGAISAAHWLLETRHAPGIHPFEVVIADALGDHRSHHREHERNAS